MGSYVRFLWRIFQLFIILIRGKTRIGSQTYRTRGLYLNKFALSSTGTHEEWLNNVFAELLDLRKGTFIDVGANVGQTLIKILRIDNDRQYIGFEPQIACSFFINRFLADNRLESHKIIPIGLSNHSGLVKLHTRNASDPAASMIENFRPINFYASYQYTYVARGDDVLSEFNIDAISVLKIDVEGGELEVMEGLTRIITQHTPFIVFEVLNHYIAISNEDLDSETLKFREDRIKKIEHFIQEHGYSIYNIVSYTGFRKVAEIRPPRSANLRITDYVAVHKSDEDQFRTTISKRLLE